MSFEQLQRWLQQRPGVLLNVGVTEGASELQVWLSWEEDGRELNLIWEIERSRSRTLAEAVAGVTALYARRCEGAAGG